MKYSTGEDLQNGDKVLFHGELGRIEFVAESATGDAAMDW
jgi:hypothetical protein